MGDNMDEEKYLVHDDSEYDIFKPENFSKLSEDQKQELINMLNNTPKEIKRKD